MAFFPEDDRFYRENRIDTQKPLAEFVDDLCQMPLAFHPGSQWRYSFAHDVVARLIEVLSEQPLDRFLEEKLFQPLNMKDTGFLESFRERKTSKNSLIFEGVDQSGEEASFAFHHRSAVTALSTAQSGIEQIPEGISKHVEGVDDKRQAEPQSEQEIRQPATSLWLDYW